MDKIKITSVKPIVIDASRNYGAFLMVEIRTDKGIIGYGECFAYSGTTMRIFRYLKRIGLELINKNPLDMDWYISTFYKENSNLYWASAFSGIEIALWDIAGKVANKPIYKLLSKDVKKSLPLYVNHGLFQGETKDMDQNTEKTLERAMWAKQQGYKMIKYDPFRDFGANLEYKDLIKCTDEVGLMKELLGSEYPICIDAHGRFGLEAGIAAAYELEKYDIVFFEQPYSEGRYDLFRVLSKLTTLPLATGELVTSMNQFDEMIRSNSISIFQPEVTSSGGILKTVEMAQIANKHNIKLAPHCWCGPVSMLAAIQLSAAINNLEALEYPAAAPEDSWENELVNYSINIKEGKIIVSDKPGLGFEFNEEMLKKVRIL